MRFRSFDDFAPTLPSNCGAGKRGAGFASRALCIAERLADGIERRQDHQTSSEETPP
jgi:hypothetical protein